MQNLWCSECKKRVFGDLTVFKRHYKRYHGTSGRAAGTGFLGFRCGQNGCARRFNVFSSLIRHIKSHHEEEAPGIGGNQEELGVNQELLDGNQEVLDGNQEEPGGYHEAPGGGDLGLDNENGEEIFQNEEKDFDLDAAVLK